MARRVSANDAPPTTTPVALRGDTILSGLVAAAFFARFYLPAEASAQGETLWIVGLWLLIGLVASLVRWRGGRTARRFDWRDGSVLLLVGGQVVSAVVVVLTSGDKRAAVNVAWEWFGVGMVWWLLRDRAASGSFRQAMLRASIVTGVVLAGLGLWQHYISQPQLAAQYGPLFDRLRTASGSEVESIKHKLAEAGIPTEGPGLTLYEKRLRDSREPFGLFGLTNTFGGCLAVWLVLTLGAILVALQRGHRWRSLIPLVFTAGVIVWCLLLTKSRTACIGAACGTMVLLAGQLKLSKQHHQRLAWLGGGLAVLVCLFGLLVSLGGLDRQVLSEAPKSLAYRLQYWQATSRLIAAHPWLGVGPGNFRQHYLKYKLPEASEEIADPHNLFLDVASTGGVFSLVGLVALIVLTLRNRCRDRRGENIIAASALSRSASVTADDEWLVFWCSGLGAFLAFLGPMVVSGLWGDGDRLLILSCVWAVTAWLLARSWPLISIAATGGADAPFSSIALSGVVVMFVHLLGAGGIAMPAVSQLLLALIACSLAPVSEPAVVSHPLSTRLSVGAVIGAVLILVALLTTAVIPVARCDQWMSKGDRAMGTSAFKLGDVESNYVAASRADTLSPEPWWRQAELAFRASASQDFRSNESFAATVKLLLEAIARDPQNFQGPRTLGNWWLARWRVTQNGDDAHQAADGLRRASDSYPTNASILAELAVALDASGQHADAATTAKRALAQDELNRRLGHVDRYLADELAAQLRLLAEVTDP